MATRYQCESCKHIFDAEGDGACPVCVTKALIPIEVPGEEESLARSRVEEEIPTGPLERVEGLCVLVCDASASMYEPAFPKESKYPKLKCVVDAIETAIEAMQATLTKKDTAYLAIIAFGKDARLINDLRGKPFVKSVKDILDEHGDMFALHLLEQLSDRAIVDPSGTNITAGLSLAKAIVDGALLGDMRAWGLQNRIQLIKDQFYPGGKKTEIENIRVMIYSDGAHNQGLAQNAFDGMQPVSLLMTAFIGDKDADDNTRLGAAQMEQFANICPTHSKRGTFLIDSMARRDDLRQVFHMATGGSGFCKECMKGGA